MSRGKSGNRGGFTLIELVIVVAIIAVIAAIAIPALLSGQRAANERNAASSLKTLATAQLDYRCNDRNGDGIQNFRCGVAGLYVAKNTSGGSEIRLIELSIALADADADQIGGGSYPATGTTLDGARTSAKAGYWYEDTENDVDGAPYDPDDTEHNDSKFAFACWPESLASGKSIFILNEENVVYRTQACGIGAVYEVQGRSTMPNNLNTWPGTAGPASMTLWAPLR